MNNVKNKPSHTQKNVILSNGSNYQFDVILSSPNPFDKIDRLCYVCNKKSTLLKKQRGLETQYSAK